MHDRGSITILQYTHINIIDSFVCLHTTKNKEICTMITENNWTGTRKYYFLIRPPELIPLRADDRQMTYRHYPVSPQEWSMERQFLPRGVYMWSISGSTCTCVLYCTREFLTVAVLWPFVKLFVQHRLELIAFDWEQCVNLTKDHRIPRSLQQQQRSHHYV